MKKLFKFAAILAALTVVLFLTALLALKIMFPAEKIKALAQQYVQNTLHREVTFSEVSFNIIGLTLKDFAISESTTFSEGTFVKANQAVLKVALKPLLHKRLEINTVGLEGLQVNIIKNADGTFNFDDLLPSKDTPTAPATTPAQTSSQNLVISADHLYATDCSLSYKDLQKGTETSVTQLNIDIRNFDLSNPFQAAIGFTTSYQDHTGLSINVPVQTDLQLQLANMDLAKAYLNVQRLQTTYKDIQLSLQGSVKNFEKPETELQGTLSGISNAALSDIAPDLPAFVLPTMDFQATAVADLEQSKAQITKAKLSVADSEITIDGNIGWEGEKSTYDLQTMLGLNLTQIASMTTLLDGYGMGGRLSGKLQATDKNEGKDVSGYISLSNASLQYPPFVLSELNGTVQLRSLGYIASPNLTGKLNGETFTTSFTYQDLGNLSDLILTLNLSKLVLDSFSSDSTEKQDAPKQNNAATTTAESLFNIKADVTIGEITVPYFTSKGGTLQANLQQASPSMTQANGQVSFALQEGLIQDIGSFVKENKIVKILMLPLSLIHTVSNKLGVRILSAEKVDDKNNVKFSSGSGTYVFTNGVMNIQETHFNSSLSNLTATGNINFPNDALDMRVQASVLTDQTPVIIKIGGTLSKPSGKLDVARTAVSLVEGFLNRKGGNTANTTGTATQDASGTTTQTDKSTADAAATALKGLGSLLKKKK